MLCLAVYFKIIFLSGIKYLKFIHKPVYVDVHLLSEKPTNCELTALNLYNPLRISALKLVAGSINFICLNGQT